jgi:hypothetical protein
MTGHVFISYCRRDESFVRMLDATLTAAGIPTFLDERDIRVGDSFPEKIYEGLENATELLYVVSIHSSKSTWVAEELSIAKVREKEVKGFRILPVVIDNSELPTAIRHIRYADMRQWQDPASYRAATSRLLISLGAQPAPATGALVKWWIKAGPSTAESRRVLHEFLGQMNLSLGYPHWFTGMKPLWLECVDLQIGLKLAMLTACCVPVIEADRRIAAFVNEAKAFFEAYDKMTFRWNESERRSLRDPLRRALSLLDEVEAEVTSVVFSVIPDHH